MRQPSHMTDRFSLETANNMLPLVRRIVGDILEQYREWQQAVHAFEAAAALPDSDAAVVSEAQRKAQLLAREIQGFLSELGDLGVEFKGFELGLVDFPGEVDGRLIHWCWQYGEGGVRHWHDRDAGFASRQPVETLTSHTTHSR